MRKETAKGGFLDALAGGPLDAHGDDDVASVIDAAAAPAPAARHDNGRRR
jgi:hypothetical protein